MVDAAVLSLLATLCTMVQAENGGGLLGVIPLAGALDGLKNLFQPAVFNKNALVVDASGAADNKLPQNSAVGDAVQSVTVSAEPSIKCQSLTGPIAAMLMSTCQSTAATAAGVIWGSRLQQLFDKQTSTDQVGNGLTTGIRETCEQLAQKQSCDQLGLMLAKCDLAGAINAFIGHMQAKQRCKKLTSLFTKDVDLVKGIGGVVGNEFLGSLMQKFLG